MKLDYLEKLADAHESQFDDYEDLHEQVCDAIMERSVLKYGALNQYSVTPFDSNDLGDKVYANSGLMLQAYIKGDDAELLKLIKNVCSNEIDAIVDLIGD